MLNVGEIPENVTTYDGDFLSTLREPKSAKALWADVYFYLIGDPMKQKNNKIRNYIKQQMDEKAKKTIRERFKSNKSFSIASKFLNSNKKVTFQDSTESLQKRPSPKASKNNVFPELETDAKFITPIT
jgi:hypothetical protein